jgi:hypothetical protein
MTLNDTVESAAQIVRSFQFREIVERGKRIFHDRAFLGPKFSLPDIRTDDLETQIDSLFAGVSIDTFVETICSKAVIPKDGRRALIEKMHIGDLRFLGDPDLQFPLGHVNWAQIPGFAPWPKVPSWKMSFRHSAHIYGDVKKIWNLNKHAQWVMLACSVYEEDSEDELDFLLQEWEGWLRANTLGKGINWTSELEVAERAINWLVCLCLLKNKLKSHKEMVRRIAEGLLSHGVFLSKRLTTWSYNHCIGESTALIMLAHFFYGYPFANKWGKRATSNLICKVKSLVSEDGYYREKSLSYSALVAQYLALSSLLLGPIEGKFLIERYFSLINELKKISTMGGILPRFGDDDNASILNYKFLENISVLGHPLFQLMTAEFEKPFSKGFKNVESHKSCFDLAVLREGAYEAALNLDNAPISANVAPHIHDDVLHVSLWHDGAPVIIDSGTFSYSSDRLKRRWYRSAAAHNRPRSACIAESVQFGFFRWRSIIRGLNHDFRTYSGLSLAGAKTSPSEVLRYVLLNAGYCLIFDRVPCSGSVSSIITTTFCFGKSKLVRKQGMGYFFISGLFGYANVCSQILGDTRSIQYEWHTQGFSEHYGLERKGSAISLLYQSGVPVWSIWLISVVNPNKKNAYCNSRIQRIDPTSCCVVDQEGNRLVVMTREIDNLIVEIFGSNEPVVVHLSSRT